MTQPVVVVGATGNQGSAVLKHLYAADVKDIKAVTRDVTNPRCQQLAKVFDGVNLVAADLEDATSLEAAFKAENGTVVFAMSTPSLAGVGYATDAEREIVVGKAMVDAAKKAGVKHMVFSSIAACDKEEAPAHFRSKKAIEDHLKESGIDWTIIRPVSFFEIWARLNPPRKGVVSGMVKGNVKTQWVSLEDVGAVGALICMNPSSYKGKTITLVGEDISGNEMAEQLGKLRKEKFSYSVGWFMRIFMSYAAGAIYEERVTFQEQHGGFNGDLQSASEIAKSFPDCFKRTYILNFERFCDRYNMVEATLPAASGFGMMVLYFLGFLGAAIAAAANLLPSEIWEDIKKRWAFYIFALLFGLSILNKIMSFFKR